MTKVTFQNKVGPFTETLKARINSYFESHKLDLTGNRHLYIKTAILITLLFANYFTLSNLRKNNTTLLLKIKLQTGETVIKKIIY